MMAKLAEYAAPKLGRVEHVGDPSRPVSVAVGDADEFRRIAQDVVNKT